VNAPLVSVILPTYNRAQVLPRAVDSVLAQTMEDFELLVIDDCSSDGSLAWLQARGDARLRVIRRTGRPGGAAPARNLGVRSARAGLIAFQDSDDEWLPRKLERQLAVLRDSGPEVGWVGGAYQVDEQVVSSPRLVQGEGYDRDLVVGAPFVTPTWLVRRECLEQAGLFDESMPCLEDWDLIFKLSAVCRFRSAPEVVLARYGSADSLYANLDKRRAGLLVMLERHRASFQREPRLYAGWCTELGRLLVLAGDAAAGRHWLAEARRQDRWQLRAAALLAAGRIHLRLLRRLSRSRLVVNH
jgi:glycosyltransferase involved in cell wall biosynthesis